MLIPYNST